MSNECFKIESGVLLSYTGTDATVTIPEGVTEIATQAFSDLTSLVTLRLSSTVAHICKRAFTECPAFCELVFTATPKTLRIHAEAWGEAQIKSVYIEDLASWCATDHYYLKTYGETEYDDRFPPFSNATFYIGGKADDCLVIPEGIERIGRRAFQMGKLSHVVLSEGVREIADNAFSYSHALESLSLPTTLREIGVEAFRGCSQLKDISFSEGLLHIGKQAFYDCEALKRVVLPRGLQTVGDDAFGSCGCLASVTFTTPVKRLKSTFQSCSGLTEVVLPEGVEEIEGVFSACGALSSVTLPSTLKILGKSTFSCCYELTSVVIPEGVTEIGESAFCFSKKLSDIRLPSTLKKVGSEAFQGCAALEAIEFPKATAQFDRSTFDYCKSLRSIVAEGIEEVPAGFAGRCDRLEKVVLSDRVTAIRKGAFRACYALREITVPDGATVIEEEAFKECTSLERITLPDTLTEIGDSAFEKCVALTRFDAPPHLAKIGFHAFYGCSSLTAVTPPRGILKVASNAFSGCPSLVAPLTSTKFPEGFCLFDDSLNTPFDEIAPSHRQCLRHTQKATEGALSVDGQGCFALTPCTKKEYAVLMAACNEWRRVRRYTSGLDANTDNGIYDVETEETYLDFYPEHCLYKNGAVIGFADDEGHYFIIGEPNGRWLVDHSVEASGPYGEDVIDCLNFYIEKRPR